MLQLLLSQREAEACNTDDFFKFLRGSTDGFDFILSCFGRGLFPLRLVSSTDASGPVGGWWECGRICFPSKHSVQFCVLDYVHFTEEDWTCNKRRDGPGSTYSELLLHGSNLILLVGDLLANPGRDLRPSASWRLRILRGHEKTSISEQE